jgi:hypothetical protein
MLRVLRWQLIPNTHVAYANLIFGLWDEFLITKFSVLPYNNLEILHLLPEAQLQVEYEYWKFRFVLFKHNNEVAYARYC